VDPEEEEQLIQNLTETELKKCEEITRERMHAMGVVNPVICRVDLPMSMYVSARGLSQEQVVENTHLYGTNSLAMSEKNVFALIQEGLLSPLSMFQFFSAGLWLMDE